MSKLDANDVMILLGLLGLGVCFAFIWWPLAFGVVGLFLLSWGVYGAIVSSRGAVKK